MSWGEAMRARLGPHGGAWLVPEWPAPERVRAFVTTRAGGTSAGEYASMNLGAGGDAPGAVERNRAIVRAFLPGEPYWMRQVHGAAVADLDRARRDERIEADGAVARVPGAVAVVLTADCMPVLVADERGEAVGLAHAGWRGMAAGVIENTVRSLGIAPARLIAWMGPAIGPRAFEVGPEVREAFVAGDAGAAAAFAPHTPGKYLADLYALARRRLEAAGVARVWGGGFCTYRDPGRFFSYRRAKASGRMGAFIWIA